MSCQLTNHSGFSVFPRNQPRCDGRSRHRKTAKRWGTAAVEFAMVAPLFFGVLFGIVEFGRAFMVQQILTNASREGARSAVLESATLSEVQTDLQNYLTNATIPTNAATVTIWVNDVQVTGTAPNMLSNAASGDSIEVQVAVNYEDISWIPSWFIPNNQPSTDPGDPEKTVLSAATIMLAERLQ